MGRRIHNLEDILVKKHFSVNTPKGKKITISDLTDSKEDPKILVNFFHRPWGERQTITFSGEEEVIDFLDFIDKVAQHFEASDGIAKLGRLIKKDLGD